MTSLKAKATADSSAVLRNDKQGGKGDYNSDGDHNGNNNDGDHNGNNSDDNNATTTTERL